MAGRVTKLERDRAILMANDSGRVERAGLKAGRRIGLEISRRALTAFRRGQDISESIATVLERTVVLLQDAMVVAHLFGELRRQTDAPLRAGLSPVFRESVKFLKNRIALPSDRVDLLQSTYGPRAIAAVEDLREHLDIVVQRALVEIQTQGLTLRDGTKFLRKVFDKTAGLSTKNAYQLEAVFRTQTQMAYSAGNWNATRNDPDIDEILWGYKYVTVGDDRVRETHEAIDGVTLKKDDPFWSVNFPPNGWNCRCQAIPVFAPRKQVKPPEPKMVNGKEIIPGADEGFRFNPGEIIRTAA